MVPFNTDDEMVRAFRKFRKSAGFGHYNISSFNLMALPGVVGIFVIHQHEAKPLFRVGGQSWVCLVDGEGEELTVEVQGLIQSYRVADSWLTV